MGAANHEFLPGPDELTRDNTPDSGRPLRIGLTGGIASGKSTVADLFAKMGAPIVDTDIIAREVVMPGSPALAEIRSEFGADVLAPDGTLDRKRMRKLVFADDERRQALETILHPRIREESERQVADATGAYVLIVVPLLVESPMKEMMDRILVVDCSEETQIKRLMARDVESEAQARRIMATQSSREQRLAIADDVIRNDDGLDELRARVVALHKAYSKNEI